MRFDSMFKALAVLIVVAILIAIGGGVWIGSCL